MLNRQQPKRDQKEWHIAAKPGTQELDKKGYVDATIL
jgi:hypothetical protein